MESIYLDHAATTPLHPDVQEKMIQVMRHTFGNPSSQHTFGRQAKKEVMEARKIAAASIHAAEHEIIFNGGATEGNNSVVMETARKREKEGKHIITTRVEHPSVYKAMRLLERRGFDVTYLDLEEDGGFSLETFKNALRDDTILVSIMSVNNEIGTIFPIKEIGEIVKDHQAWFHTDAVQAYGVLDIDVKEWQVDFLTISAHKINGPKGVGFLYARDGVRLPAMLIGGEQEEKRRAGTENVVGIAGTGAAISIKETLDKKEKNAYFEQCWLCLEKRFVEADLPYTIAAGEVKKAPHIRNVWIHGIPADLLLIQLDLLGFAVSAGSACTAGAVAPSRILSDLYGKDHPALKESIRISLGYGTTVEQIDILAQTIVDIYHRLKKD